MTSITSILDGITSGAMDKEQIVILAGVTICALSIGAFIFWGPNPRPRSRGAIVGLQNLGLTCFLNTLLQALASCPIFIEWIEACQEQGSVALSLYYLLKVLSTERGRLPAGAEDPLDPSQLMAALRHHGWTIAPGEQDAHELFNLLMVTLEEEAHKAVPSDGGLSDCPEPKEVEEDLPHPVKRDNDDKSEPQAPLDSTSDSTDDIVNAPSGDTQLLPQSLSTQQRLFSEPGQIIRRKFAPKYDYNRNYQGSPFCGLLTSQLLCVECGFKSVVRYDKFDSLSLHLPDGGMSGITLRRLLEGYTRPEAVTGVACDGCNRGRPPGDAPLTSTSLKTISIGKLPRCLCIHIHRMSICGNGTPYKRSEYVDFPEFLQMDPYTHNAMIKDMKYKTEPSSEESEEREASTSKTLPNRTRASQNLYRIKAVVVHCGSADGGHFVTYRRGPLRSDTRHRSDRWYFTSDETVRDATLAEAMQASAYMLFYEKCTSPLT